MRKLLLLAFVAFLDTSSVIFAGVTGKIAGTVIDADNREPLPGVNVWIEGTTMGAVTDRNGYYVILNIPPGVYTVTATLIGYTRQRVTSVTVKIDLTTEQNFQMKPQTIPTGVEPDPLNAAGDTLYSIYRKGLITRHITKNGRLLEVIALESIDDFTKEAYGASGYIDVKRRDGTLALRMPMENTRYSEELVPGTHKVAPYLWVPVVAPIKNPGYSNDGYYVLSSGTGDNPLYWGGMALATFSLEHMYNVSPHSIGYARKLVQYFLSSEMTGQNGYMVRRPNFFDSNRNGNGEPIIQGASPEELLGTMLGLMFYLRAEDSSYPLYSEAKELRDRVLQQIPLSATFYIFGYPLPRYYEHPFMSSRKDPSYMMSHFSFPFFTSKGTILENHPTTGKGPEYDYFFYLTSSAGTSRSLEPGHSFFEYVMYLTSMILVLEGDISENAKEAYAETFMDEFIKAAMTSGPDIDALKGNAYMGVVAKLANKYLSAKRDSEFEGQKLQNIWEGEWKKWKDLKRSVIAKIKTPKSLHNNEQKFDDSLNVYWQHNLPLWEPRIEYDPDGDKDHDGIPNNIDYDYIRDYYEQLEALQNVWKNHNPNNRIGAWFVWGHSYPYRFRKDAGRWYENFPGWSKGDYLNESEYKTSTGKKYSGFLQKEIAEARNHHDNQVEGAGLGLLFLRMLLTHINPKEYPPPHLPDGYNKRYEVLPWPGVEPMHPQSLYHKHRYWSKDKNIIGQFKIEGDQDQALRIVTLGKDLSFRHNFVVGFATEDEKLKLVPGFVSDDGSGIYLSSNGKTWPKHNQGFDKAELARTQDESGNEYVVVAERAEGGGTFCDEHWLRLELWKMSGQAEGHAGTLTDWAKWEHPPDQRHCDSVEELNMAIVDKKYVAVIFRTRNEKNRIRIFKIDFANKSITEVLNRSISEELYDHSIAITTAYNDLIIYNPQSSTDWHLVSEKWTGNQLQFMSSTVYYEDEKLLGITTVKKLDFTQPDYAGGYYLVAVTMRKGYLRIYSWEVVKDGRLIFRGQFNTKDGEEYLVGREADWERASISSVYWKNRSGFVIAGKGVAREVRDEDGDWQKSAKGLKVVYGYIMNDGRPTIESSNVIGSGESDAMRMLDVSDGLNYGDNLGVLTAHKTKDDHLMLIFWVFDDKFENFRWNQ